MKRYSLIILVLIAFTAGHACKKDALETYGNNYPGNSSTYPVSGEWWVIYSLNGAAQGGYYALLTYNLATNKGDSIWVDDYGDFWQEEIKVKSLVDVKDKTFTISNAPNLNGSTTVTLVDGKVLMGKATTSGGNKSDSIYVKFVYSDDATDTFVCAGYRRTGFKVDDH